LTYVNGDGEWCVDRNVENGAIIRSTRKDGAVYYTGLIIDELAQFENEYEEGLEE
jgi:hypothetical protein